MLAFILGIAIGIIICIEKSEVEKELEKQGKKKENKHTGLKVGIIGLSIWNQFCKDAKKRR